MPQVERRSQGSYGHFRTTDIILNEPKPATNYLDHRMGIYSERKEKESEAERKIREMGSKEYEGEARRSAETDEREDERTDERNNKR